MLQCHGYDKLANTLAVASSERDGKGRGARVLLMMLIGGGFLFSKLIDLLYYITPF